MDALIQGDVANFALERKTPSDLVRSSRMKDKESGEAHLWKQCKILAQMRDELGYSVALVIVGKPDWKFYKYSHCSKPQYWGLKIGIWRFGIPVFEVADKEEYVYLLKALNEKAGKKVEYSRPTISKRGRSADDERLDVLTALEGVGPKTGKQILTSFGSVAEFVNALGKSEDLVKVMGEKEAKHAEEIVYGKMEPDTTASKAAN